jgi:fatty-acyl-CoA synthase
MSPEQEFPRIGHDYQLNLVKLLQRAAMIHPQGEISYKGLVRYNYAQAYERCQRLSSALRELGVKPGSKVITFEWNTHRHFEVYFGVPCMGAIMHMGNPFLTPQQIIYLVNRAQDEILILNQDVIPLIESVQDKLESVRHYIVMSDDGQIPPTKLSPVHEYESLLAAAAPEYAYPELDERTVASLSNTTGTTGDPKICFFSHRQHILHTMVWTIMLLGFSGERGFDPRRDVMIPVVPMFHAHGWSLPYMATLLGCRQVFPGRFEATAFLDLVKKEKRPDQGGFMQCVPTMLDMIINHPKVDKYKDHLRGLIYEAGGSRLPKKLGLRAKELGIDLCAGWGMTEIYTKVALQFLKPHMFDWPSDRQLDFLIRTGMAVPLVEQRVVDGQGNDVPKDGAAMGEIVLRAPWLTAGYYKDPKMSAELWRGGWLHTGDLATMDEEHSILIADRNKDVIKSGGEWISTLTLESLLSLHPKVREVAVIGARSEKWGERPLALIVPKPEAGPVTEQELQEHLTQYVAEGKILKWWIPDKFLAVEEIPKTSVGKLNKKKMRSLYDGELEKNFA